MTDRREQLNAVAIDYAVKLRQELAVMLTADGLTNNTDAAYIISMTLANMIQSHILVIAELDIYTARHHRDRLAQLLIDSRAWL